LRRPACTRTERAIRLDEVREHRVGQHRQMAEVVVEQVRFHQVVEFIAPSHPDRHGETALGQVREEIRFGDQAGHADDLETSQPLQTFTGFGEHRDPARVGAQQA
jgi:hypothetical protein